MLMFKAQQVIGCTRDEPKPWTMEGRSGTTHSARLALYGSTGEVAEIKLKAKTAEELTSKVAKYTIGKPAEVPLTGVVPVFRAGDKRPSGYEYVG